MKQNILMKYSKFFFASSQKSKMKTIVLLGNGWAGYRFAKGLSKCQWDLKLVSPRNHFIFTPLLASSTVGTVEFRAITEPARNVCKNYYLGECKKINANAKKIVCFDKHHNTEYEMPYDYLVIAVGATPNTFKIPGVEENCFFLRVVQDAKKIRKRLLTCLEQASSPACSPEERKKLLSFVVVGGGPTSIEFSSELCDFLNSDFKKLYPSLNKADISITVIEASDRVLGMFDKDLSAYTEKNLKDHQVKVFTKACVKEIKPGMIHLQDGREIPFGLCVWSTGNRPTEFLQSLQLPKAPNGRILVDGNLRVKGMKDVFAIGDCAVPEGSRLPQTAQVANQEGKYLSAFFNKGLMPYEPPFHYQHLGSMAYLGGHKAILQTKKRRIKGILAYLIWRSGYWARQMTFKSQLLVPIFWLKTCLFGRDISLF